MNIKQSRAEMLNINAPEWFLAPAFNEWINSTANSAMSWHPKGTEPGEYSDILVFVDPSLSGEGTSDNMPALYWFQIMDACRDHFSPVAGEYIIVRLTNIIE